MLPLTAMSAAAMLPHCHRHAGRASLAADAFPWHDARLAMPSSFPNSHPRSHLRSATASYAGLLLMTVCVYIIMYAPQPMFNNISRDFGASRSLTGLCVSVFMLSLAVSPVCVGLFLGRAGLNRTLSITSMLLGASGFALYFSPNFWVFLGVRAIEALLVPVALTGVMAGIASLFRHFDLKRALAGYVTSNLVGSMIGRIGGGWCAQYLGWRATLALACALFFLAAPLLRNLPQGIRSGSRTHSLKQYCALLKNREIAGLMFVEACGIFVFAAVGNLLAFRMADLGKGQSEGLIGMMYLGYSIGLAVSLALPFLLRAFRKKTLLMLAGSATYVSSLILLLFPSAWALFACLCFMALGEFIIHSICPGLINSAALRFHSCDRGMVNGLFLSCYYFGGVLGSYIPAVLYGAFGWAACCASLILVQAASFLAIAAFSRQWEAIR